MTAKRSPVDRQRIDQAAHGDGRPAEQGAARAAGRRGLVEQASALVDQVVGCGTLIDRPDLLDRPEIKEVGALGAVPTSVPVWRAVTNSPMLIGESTIVFC